MSTGAQQGGPCGIRGGGSQTVAEGLRRIARLSAIEVQLQDNPSDRGLAEHQARDHSVRPIFVPEA